MKLEFESESDKITYAEWKARLIDQMYGDGIELHHDLYELSHAHRLEHGENDCSVWPSPPYRAPLWRLLAEIVVKMGGRLVRHARRLVFQLAEVAVSRDVFRQVLERIAGLHPAPG